MVIFVENRHNIQGVCFFITISISEKDVPFAWTPPPVPFCPFLADPLPPPDLGRPFWMPPNAYL